MRTENQPRKYETESLIIQLSEPKPTNEERSTRVEVKWLVFMIFYTTSFLSHTLTRKEFQLHAIRDTYKVHRLFQTWKHDYRLTSASWRKNEVIQ